MARDREVIVLREETTHARGSAMVLFACQHTAPALGKIARTQDRLRHQTRKIASAQKKRSGILYFFRKAVD